MTQPPPLLPLETLDNCEVVRWIGSEDALSWDEEGDEVSSVVIVPLHNGIACKRLGVLDVQLDQCDLV